jgi:hypothetical protein
MATYIAWKFREPEHSRNFQAPEPLRKRLGRKWDLDKGRNGVDFFVQRIMETKRFESYALSGRGLLDGSFPGVKTRGLSSHAPLGRTEWLGPCAPKGQKDSARGFNPGARKMIII